MNNYSHKTHPDRCDCDAIHEEIVRRVQEAQPSAADLSDLAELFKVFGDVTRVRIISALIHAEMCVCDIAALLGMTKSAISHQLRALRQTKLVKNRKDGKIVYYSLDDEHVAILFAQGLAHAREKSGQQTDGDAVRTELDGASKPRSAQQQTTENPASVETALPARTSMRWPRFF